MASTVTARLMARQGKATLRHTHFSIYLARRYSVAEQGVLTLDSRTTENALDEEQRAKVDGLRNVSRLSPNYYKQYHGQSPDLRYKDLYTRKMLYAKFGAASGEDPKILWPPRVKLLDQELEEQEEGSPLSERLAQLQSEMEAAEKAKMERHKVITNNMSQMPKWIEEYRKKGAAAEKAAKERARKKEVLLHEAQDYYGYKIQVNDPKFQQMLEEKELKEKTEKKKRKKEEKLQKHALKQQQELTQTKEVGKEE